MAFCTYCGSKVEDNAKFCTACGAPIETAKTPAAQEPVPVQGSYTAPIQGSYTAPQQGTYTPAQSYDAAQQPTSGAADSGSYTAPAQEYSTVGTSYAHKAKAKMPKMPSMPKGGGKKRLMMFGGIALAVILLIALVSSCGKDKQEVIQPAEIAENAQGGEMLQPGAEASALQQQWNGTWFGTMYVYEAEGDFSGIPTDDVVDCYMVVDVDSEGKGTYEVYFDEVFDEPYAAAECQAYDYGMDTTGGTIVDMLEMDTYNWMFRPVPDYPDRYTITDSIEYDDSLFEYTLFFKQWGKSWQDEIEGDEIVPYFVEDYETAIANAELPPVGFAPIGYAGNGAAVSAVVENPGAWYGWVSFTEFENIDSEDLMYDAWAFVDEDDDGNSYIKIHQDGYPDTPLMFMYADIEGNKIVPAIGSEDAWFSDTYLDEEDADMYEGVLGADGVLRFDYFFTHYDGEYGYRVQMNFRTDGTEWDENNDILPPRYDEYKAALAGGESESQPAQAEEPAPAAEPAQSAGGPSGFGGEHTATLAEFMTDIPADFTFTVPESGWVLDVYSDSTIYIYNVPTPDDAYSDSPRIQFELKENLDKINFYKDNFENLKDIDSRTIGGIEMQGRTYKNVGMYWTEYYGELPSGVWVTCKISDVDISAGSEGAAILDSVTIK